MARLTGKVAIVTGAAQGIGAHYAMALAKEGAAVCACDLAAPEKTTSAIEAAGGKAMAVAADVSKTEAVRTMVAATIERFGAVDILVNNAAIFGTLGHKPFEEISSADWDALMAVNVRGPFECAKAVMPHMRQKKYGKIVNIASGTVFKGSPMMLHYVTSKGAMVAFTRALAREAGTDGICVNCIAPGLTLSENVRANQSYVEDFIVNNVKTRALQREMESEDLLGTLVYLCSPDSDFVTGQTIVVDGGSVMH